MSFISSSRRSFLKASAAVIASNAFVLPFAHAAGGPASANSFEQGYLRIVQAGTITVVSPVAEVGQGTTTTLAMILGDALDADWSTIEFELVGVGPQFVKPTYGMQLTGASTGVSGFHDTFRRSGATARAMLMGAAAKRWSVTPDECETAAGRVVLKSGGKSLSYGELAAAASTLAVPSPESVEGAASRFVGKRVARLDIPSKVNGSAKYAIDVRMPDLLYATAVMAPVFGAKPAKYDRAKVMGRNGVHSVLELQDGVAIVANRWWTAHSAVDDLNVEWTATGNDKTSDETISAQLWRDLKEQKPFLANKAGKPDEIFTGAKSVMTRGYEVPFLAHTTMEPMACVAKVDASSCEVWFASQRPDHAREVAAKYLGLPETAVTVHPTLGGGGFGRRQESDVVLQAVTIAKSVPGRPVKLLWPREEDVQHDFYRPAGVSELSAVISGGQVEALRHRQASPSVLPRAFPAVFSLVPYDLSVADGVYPIYGFPNQDATWVRSDTHVPAGMWRTVGASQNIFAIESFIDELAAETGQDAFAFRREHLKHDARALAAFDRLGELCDWPSVSSKGRAVGLAISHKNDDCLVAQAAEISMDKGKLRVRKIWSVADSGKVFAPDIARGQIEGAAIWALTAALYGKITIADGRVQESNFDGYQMVRLDETPEFVTEFIESGAKVEGMGEGGGPGVAPAVCNALFKLTGKRIRRLPIMSQLG
ncbi:molybdopterin-dependent oxidoreductase (plasmid) [Bradyrhizobium barranii]|uniref:Molybdopterin-dependent oxidoreductase n=2 Tax=Bradyrhizobium TaxID=374 RepID=A0ABY3R0E4_9BRAD|nr:MULTISPECIES: molybdopterin cofactor-binding domain-containing protein [Bradyrhizobium]UFW91757.1 molybdopterin-dependent oxidoreductase [Bradyrhizobium japonicum]WFU00281.1 molybdopterin-dependent oxidoreductase [Bradyrhizobium barranii]